MISAIIFSKDRPLQLQAYIESLTFFTEFPHHELYVLYKSNDLISYDSLIESYPKINWITETNFFDNLNQILAKCQNYILWGCDDVFYKSSFDIAYCIQILEKHQEVLAFSLRLGINIQSGDYSFIEYRDSYMVWNWTTYNSLYSTESSDWSYPWEVSASIYRKSDILFFIHCITQPVNPNYLESTIASLLKLGQIQTKEYLACFPLSKALTLTINRVQHTHPNVFDVKQLTNPNYLYECFMKSYKINWIEFQDCKNSVIHVGGEYFKLEIPQNNSLQSNSILVSIICRTYNRAQFIEETITSVLSQTYQNFEFLILDDGSTDNTQQIIQKYISDSRIKYVYQENIGKNLDAFGRLTNKCISLTKGQLIAIVDSDDIVLPHRLEKQVSEFQIDPDLDIVFSNGFHIDQDNCILNSNFKHEESLKLNRLNLLRLLFRKNIIANPTIMIKRESLINMGGFDELGVGEDYHFWLKSAPYLNFKYLDEKLIKYRIHQGGATTAPNRQRAVFDASIAILKQIRNTFSIFDFYPEIYGCQFRSDALYSAYLHLGNIMLTNNFSTPDLAVLEYSSALKHRASGIEALNNLAVALWILGDCTSSKNLFEQLKTFPASSEVRHIFNHNNNQASTFSQVSKTFIILGQSVDQSSLLQRMKQFNSLIDVDNWTSWEIQISCQENHNSLNLDFAEINILLAPDVSQPEEALYIDLKSVFVDAMTRYPQDRKIKLWIYLDYNQETIQDIIASIIFDIFMEQGKSLENLEVDFIGNLSDSALSFFLSQIQGKVNLQHENQKVVASAREKLVPNLNSDLRF